MEFLIQIGKQVEHPTLYMCVVLQTIHLVNQHVSFSCNEVIQCHEPRFATEDRWRSCHFGAHPRQIVFMDTTVVQTYDLRVR